MTSRNLSYFNSTEFNTENSFTIQSLYRVTPDTCYFPACDNDPNLCPGYMICESEKSPAFTAVESFCIYVFTIEYCLRLLCCWAVSPRFECYMFCVLYTYDECANRLFSLLSSLLLALLNYLPPTLTHFLLTSFLPLKLPPSFPPSLSPSSN
jgi:hypothetical protein